MEKNSIKIWHNGKSHFGILIRREFVEWACLERQEVERKESKLYNVPVQTTKNIRAENIGHCSLPSVFVSIRDTEMSELW